MTTPTTTANLRREARIDARIPVTIVRGRKTEELETSDVSFKGLFMRTASPPPLRSLVRLRVALPAGSAKREIEVHAMAIHVIAPRDDHQGGVGLQFWGLAGPDRQVWDDFIRTLIQARRAAAKAAATSATVKVHPAYGEAPTPSGVRAVAATTITSPHVSSKK
jgi:hypothetical protein